MRQTAEEQGGTGLAFGIMAAAHGDEVGQLDRVADGLGNLLAEFLGDHVGLDRIGEQDAAHAVRGLAGDLGNFLRGGFRAHTSFSILEMNFLRV